MPSRIVITVVVLLGACNPERPSTWESARTLLGPIAMKDRIAYVDSARNRVSILDASTETPHASGLRIGRKAIFALPTPDRTKLLVVTKGQTAIYENDRA